MCASAKALSSNSSAIPNHATSRSKFVDRELVQLVVRQRHCVVAGDAELVRELGHLRMRPSLAGTNPALEGGVVVEVAMAVEVIALEPAIDRERARQRVPDLRHEHRVGRDRQVPEDVMRDEQAVTGARGEDPVEVRLHLRDPEVGAEVLVRAALVVVGLAQDIRHRERAALVHTVEDHGPVPGALQQRRRDRDREALLHGHFVAIRRITTGSSSPSLARPALSVNSVISSPASRSFCVSSSATMNRR